MLNLEHVLLEGILINGIYLQLRRYLFGWQPDDDIIGLLHSEVRRVLSKKPTVAHKIYVQDLVCIAQSEVAEYNLLSQCADRQPEEMRLILVKIIENFALAIFNHMQVLRQIIAQKEFEHCADDCAC